MIVALEAFRQFQPIRAGRYGTSGGIVDGFESTIVALTSDDGTVGWGEAAPLGAFYADGFPDGIRAAVAELAPLVIGSDESAPWPLVRRLDAAMRRQPAAKAAIDMAVRDLGARSTGVPLAEALGGRDGDSVALYHAVAPAPPDEMAATAAAYTAAGYRRIQVKVGGDPLADARRLRAVRDAVGADVALLCDANGRWPTGAAIRFLVATSGLDYALEQPCATIEENALVRRHCDRPLILDESVDDLRTLLACRTEAGCDGVTIKLARVGGVTRAALLRDVAVELGLTVTIEDTGGAEIATAAMIQLSLGTPEHLRLHTVDFHAWVTVSNAAGLPAAIDGRIGAPAGLGLGVDVARDALGEPFVSVRS